MNTGPRGNDDQILSDAAGVGLKIVKAIFTEMSALFPDQAMHVGCDETTVTANCTLESTTSFEVQIIKHVASLNKRPMAWEEALVTGAADAQPAMTLQLWYADFVFVFGLFVDLHQFCTTAERHDRFVVLVCVGCVTLTIPFTAADRGKNMSDWRANGGLQDTEP
jgi:hypothetical protein